MLTGACGWRRQKGILQTVFCLLALLCLGSGLFLYRHLQDKVVSSESQSLKFKQLQEALSAQLQVVYEHRSRLERSLQKERGEHKKTKEDFLVYKLEAQETLNKEKQDAMNRYGALTSQHKILKNQHEDVKKQFVDMQTEHNALKLQHRRAVEGHGQKYTQLQQEKENQVMILQDTIVKLREESKLLRKAHQEVHSQLLSAQVQLEEFRQLKEALQRMPSFKELGTARGPQQFQFLAPNKKEQKLVAGVTREEDDSPREAAPQEKPALGAQQAPDPTDAQVKSWQDIVNKVNARKNDENPQTLPHGVTNPRGAHLQLAKPELRMEGLPANLEEEEENKDGADDEELEMDAGMIDREEGADTGHQHIVQEPMMPEDVADPAQDPNNQGEDEFEEAALERPAFAVKAPRAERGGESKQPAEGEAPQKAKEAGAQQKAGDEAIDDYQEDQEPDMEDHGGEVDDAEDLELVQENKSPGDDPEGNHRKDDYY